MYRHAWCLNLENNYIILSDMASIAGAVSAIAFVASLVFLNIQVHQSEKSQRAMIQQGRAERTADIAMRLLSSNFAEVYCRCIKGDSSISETQLIQFMGYCRAVFLGAEDSFLQNRESQLDEMAFVSFTTSLRAIFVSPGVRTVWKMTRGWYGPEFEAFMDIIAKEAANSLQADPLLEWKTVISTEIHETGS